MFHSFVLVSVHGFLVNLLGLSTVPVSLHRRFDAIPIRLFGSSLKFGIAAPPATSLSFGLRLSSMWWDFFSMLQQKQCWLKRHLSAGSIEIIHTDISEKGANIILKRKECVPAAMTLSTTSNLKTGQTSHVCLVCCCKLYTFRSKQLRTSSLNVEKSSACNQM